jgi:hypothetical protein
MHVDGCECEWIYIIGLHIEGNIAWRFGWGGEYKMINKWKIGYLCSSTLIHLYKFK